MKIMKKKSVLLLFALLIFRLTYASELTPNDELKKEAFSGDDRIFKVFVLCPVQLDQINQWRVSNALISYEDVMAKYKNEVIIITRKMYYSLPNDKQGQFKDWVKTNQSFIIQQKSLNNNNNTGNFPYFLDSTDYNIIKEIFNK